MKNIYPNSRWTQRSARLARAHPGGHHRQPMWAAQWKEFGMAAIELAAVRMEEWRICTAMELEAVLAGADPLLTMVRFHEEVERLEQPKSQKINDYWQNFGFIQVL